jgi:hypothetical protein
LHILPVVVTVHFCRLLLSVSCVMASNEWVVVVVSFWP